MCPGVGLPPPYPPPQRFGRQMGGVNVPQGFRSKIKKTYKNLLKLTIPMVEFEEATS